MRLWCGVVRTSGKKHTTGNEVPNKRMRNTLIREVCETQPMREKYRAQGRKIHLNIDTSKCCRGEIRRRWYYGWCVIDCRFVRTLEKVHFLSAIDHVFALFARARQALFVLLMVNHA